MLLAPLTYLVPLQFLNILFMIICRVVYQNLIKARENGDTSAVKTHFDRFAIFDLQSVFVNFNQSVR